MYQREHYKPTSDPLCAALRILKVDQTLPQWKEDDALAEHAGGRSNSLQLRWPLVEYFGLACIRTVLTTDNTIAQTWQVLSVDPHSTFYERYANRYCCTRSQARSRYKLNQRIYFASPVSAFSSCPNISLGIYNPRCNKLSGEHQLLATPFVLWDW